MKPSVKPFPLEKVPESIRDDIEEIFYNMAFDPQCRHIKGLWLVGKCVTSNFVEGCRVEFITEPVSEQVGSEAYLAALGGTCGTDDSSRFKVYLANTKLTDVVRSGEFCLRLV